MKVLIVEDVTLVARRIEALCKQFFVNAHCDISFDLETAKENLLTQDYDLLFLDLNVNGANGFELLSLENVDPAKVVVVTAYKEQAVNAYELAIFDFISKPITESRFAKVVRRFLLSQSGENKVISISKGNTHYQLSVSSINYVKAAGNYTEVYTYDGKMHLFSEGISFFENKFDRFIRCHRSYLTKPENIQSITKLGAGQYRLNLANSVQIPLSRAYFEGNFKDWGRQS